jgi:uncharacterized membrane protein (DUF2068 family)
VRRRNKGLVAIAIFKWCNAVVLCAVALGLLKLQHQDVVGVAENFILSLRGDPDNAFLGWILARLSLIEDPQLKTLSAVSFGYGALFLVEGTGLYFEKRWAEFLTIVATASFLPLEVYELVKKPDVPKVLVFVVNFLILLFLIITVRKNGAAQKRRR